MLDYNSIVMAKIHQKVKMLWIWFFVLFLSTGLTISLLIFQEKVKISIPVAIVSALISLVSLITLYFHKSSIAELTEDLIKN